MTIMDVQPQEENSCNAEAIYSAVRLNMTSDTHEEVCINTAISSCLYLNARKMNIECMLLLEKGSPYSIISTRLYIKLNSELTQKTNHIKLKFDDGNNIETNDKLEIFFETSRHTFDQNSIVTSIQSIDGIIGIDFLSE